MVSMFYFFTDSGSKKTEISPFYTLVSRLLPGLIRRGKFNDFQYFEKAKTLYEHNSRS